LVRYRDTLDCNTFRYGGCSDSYSLGYHQHGLYAELSWNKALVVDAADTCESESGGPSAAESPRCGCGERWRAWVASRSWRASP
jgi:hypothetical protein